MISRITAMALLLFSSPSNMGHQRILHGVARFERSQNGIGIYWRAPEHLVPYRIRKSVQYCRASTTNRRFADTARTNGSFRIWNIERGPFHLGRDIENRGWLAVMEPSGEHRSVSWIHHPFLSDRMSNAQDRAAHYLATEGPGMENAADIGVRQEIHQLI